MTFSMKLDKNYDCVFKIMSSTKIISSEFMEIMCYFNFQMEVCTHVVMCGSDENYFGQCFLIKFPQCGHFYTLHVYPVITRQSHIFNLRFSRHINCSNSNYSDQI